jgi:hypothetical protein
MFPIEMWALIEWSEKKGDYEVTKVAHTSKELESSFDWSVGFFGKSAKIVKVKVSLKRDKQGRLIVKKAS